MQAGASKKRVKVQLPPQSQERSGSARGKSGRSRSRGGGGSAGNQQQARGVQLDDARLKQEVQNRVSIASKKEAINALKVAKNLAEDAKQFLAQEVSQSQGGGVFA